MLTFVLDLSEVEVTRSSAYISPGHHIRRATIPTRNVHPFELSVSTPGVDREVEPDIQWPNPAVLYLRRTGYLHT